MKFDIKLKLELGFFGNEWKDCYILFSPITVKDAKTLRGIDINDPNTIDKGIELVKDKFIEGTGISKGVSVKLSKDDIEELPITIVNRSIELMVSSMSDGEKKIPNS